MEKGVWKKSRVSLILAGVAFFFLALAFLSEFVYPGMSTSVPVADSVLLEAPGLVVFVYQEGTGIYVVTIPKGQPDTVTSFQAFESAVEGVTAEWREVDGQKLLVINGVIVRLGGISREPTPIPEGNVPSGVPDDFAVEVWGTLEDTRTGERRLAYMCAGALAEDGYVYTATHCTSNLYQDPDYPMMIVSLSGERVRVSEIRWDSQADLARLKPERNLRGGYSFGSGVPATLIVGGEVQETAVVAGECEICGARSWALSGDATFGDSGSPVLDSEGNLLGVLVAASADGVYGVPIAGVQEWVDLAGGALAPLFMPSVQRWENQIMTVASEFGIDPNMVATLMQVESCGDYLARSPAGAFGLLQPMPDKFRQGEDPAEPMDNLRAGLRYFVKGLEISQGDVGLAFAGYNGGHGVIGRAQVQWPRETRSFFRWTTGIYQDAVAGKDSSVTLDQWLAAGGAVLCRQAENRR